MTVIATEHAFRTVFQKVQDERPYNLSHFDLPATQNRLNSIRIFTTPTASEINIAYPQKIAVGKFRHSILLTLTCTFCRIYSLGVAHSATRPTYERRKLDY
jgi:hypothetical protein